MDPQLAKIIEKRNEQAEIERLDRIRRKKELDEERRNRMIFQK